MSLSKHTDDPSRLEIVFMGPNPMQEAPLRSFERGAQASLWDEATELEYLNRVKEKAAAKACEILNNAQGQAESLRLKAQQEGYQAGAEAAQAELEEFRSAAGGAVAAVLGSIESQVAAVLNEWRGELVNLVRVAVEAGTGAQMSQERANILAALFNQAAEQLMTSRRTTVLVNPEDEAVVADIIDSAGASYRELYQVKADLNLAPGSIVLENSAGKVENTLEQRRRLVDEILSELNIGQRSATAEPAVQTEPVAQNIAANEAQQAEAAMPTPDPEIQFQQVPLGENELHEAQLAEQDLSAEHNLGSGNFDAATAFEQDAQTAYVSENEAAQEAEQIEHTELELAGVPEVEAVSPDTPDEPAADPVVVDIPLLNESLAFSEVKDENEADANDDETLA